MKMGYGMSRKNLTERSVKSAFNIWKYVVNGITALVLFLSLTIQITDWLGYRPYRILTGSMEPTLEPGEIVLIDTKDREISVGEILAFSEGSQVVIHRVQKMEADGEYRTKGDANPTEDFDTVKEPEIIGTLKIQMGELTSIWDIFSSNRRYCLIAVLILLNGSLEIAADYIKKEVEYA